MRLFSVRNLSVFAFVLPVFTSLSSAQETTAPQQVITLRPINIGDYEASMGLQRRDINDLSVLDHQSQSQLVYGSPGDNGKVVLANMTLYAPDGLPIVLLERFAGLNVSVKCKDDEGTLSLTFGTTDAFDYAMKQWGYVNEADDGEFLFITNKDGCGPDGQRQAYTVSNITDDTATLTTSLVAKAVALSSVAGSYDLDFGHAVPVSQAHRLKRGLLSDIDHEGEEISNSTSGNLDKDINNFSVNVSAGQQGQRSNIHTDSNAGFALDCINCFIAGSFTVQGHISVQNFTIQDLTLTASPSSVFAALELEAMITATDDTQSITYNKTLFSGPIPGAGYGLHDIMSIGASLSYTVVGSCAFSGSASMEIGAGARLPDSAQIIANYQNHGSSSASGFDSIQVTPSFRINNESASMDLHAISQPAITFGVDLKEAGKAGMTISVNLPELSTTLSIERGEDGACSNITDSSETGVEVVSEASIEVDLTFDAALGADEKSLGVGAGPWPLFRTSMPLPSTCYSLNIPGLGPSSNATKIPSLLASKTMSSPSSGIFASSTPGLKLGDSLLRNSSSRPTLLSDSSTTSGSQARSTSIEGILGLGNLPGPGMTSTTPSSTEPASALFSADSAVVSSASGSRPTSDVVFSSKIDLPTSTIPFTDTQSTTYTSDGVGEASPSSRSNQEMTSVKTPDTSRLSSLTGLSSNLPSTSTDFAVSSTSTLDMSSIFSNLGSSSISVSSILSGLGTGPISPPATSSTLSNTESKSVLSSPTSTGNRMTSLSVPTTSSIASTFESSSTLHTTTLPSPKTTSITNTAKSRPSSTISTDLSFSFLIVEGSSTLSSLSSRTSETKSSSALTISSTSSRTGLPSILGFTVSSSLKTATTRTSDSSKAEALPSTSSPVSKRSSTASTSATTTTSRVSGTERISTLLPASSSNFETTSARTPAASKVQPSTTLSPSITTKFKITSSPTTSSTLSRSKSSPTLLSPTSSSPKTTSAATSQIASTSESASTLHATTRSSTTLAEHTIEVTTATATPSLTSLSHPVNTEFSPQSTSSITVSTPSPKTQISTTSTPTTSTPSASSHSTAPILPATSIHSATKEAEATQTPVKDSQTKSPNVPSPKPDVNPPNPTPSAKGEGTPSSRHHGGSKGSGGSGHSGGSFKNPSFRPESHTKAAT